jgi:thiol-disulfide isomerase/thioredoxin
MALRLALRTVTVLVVLCVAMLGVELYRMAQPARGAGLALEPSDAPARPVLGEFNALAEPRPAPDISFAAPSGAMQSLAALRGRVVLVNFWATWCAPCIREMPSLVRLQEKFADLAVLAVSEDVRGAELVEPFVAKYRLTGLAIFLDPKNASRRAFNFGGLPTSFLIGRDGRIVGDVEGAAEWDAPAMLKLIGGYLAAPKAANAG